MPEAQEVPPARAGGDVLRSTVRRGLRSVARSARAQRWLEGLALEFGEAVADRRGDGAARALYLMSRSLGDLPAGGDEIGTSAFRPGDDDEALLALIARAFAWHPDERWDRARLEGEIDAPGFTGGDIRLHRRGDALAGFCWTKRTVAHDGSRGLVFLVGVDPAWRGRGLGRHLVLAGLHHLRDQGAPKAILYVDTTNHRAVKLYVGLGFTVVHTEHRFDQPPLAVP